jgi:hypothetical protein
MILFLKKFQIIKALIFIPLLFVVLKVKSVEQSNDNPSKNKYCADVKDGKLVVLQEDKMLEAEVTLGNGSRITPEANLIQKDGTTMMLKAGECVDIDGNIIKPTKENVKKEIKKID